MLLTIGRSEPQCGELGAEVADTAVHDTLDRRADERVLRGGEQVDLHPGGFRRGAHTRRVHDVEHQVRNGEHRPADTDRASQLPVPHGEHGDGTQREMEHPDVTDEVGAGGADSVRPVHPEPRKVRRESLRRDG